MSIVLAGLAVSIAFATVILCLLHRLSYLPAPAHAKRSDISIEARYRPMERLLASRDATFLTCQPGFNLTMTRGFRSRRREILRAYLRCLSKDFDRIYRTLEIAVVQSPVDRADLLRMMFQQKVRFELWMFIIETQVAFSALGISRGNVRRMVVSMRTLANTLSLLQTSPQPALCRIPGE